MLTLQGRRLNLTRKVVCFPVGFGGSRDCQKVSESAKKFLNMLALAGSLIQVSILRVRGTQEDLHKICTRSSN